MRTLRLRDFIFVVRELEVDTAAMNIDCFAEMLGGHSGTFNVPARSAATPLTVPDRVFRLAVFRKLPKRKIRRIALAEIDIDPGARLIVFWFALREPAIIFLSSISVTLRA